MKLKIKLFLLLLSLMNLNAYSKNKDLTKKYKCEVEFALGKYNIQHKETLEKCIQKIPENEVIKLIYVISSANQIGNVKNNEILAQKRLDSARDFLNSQPDRFKTAITEELSMGRNHVLGKKVHILILTSNKLSPEIRTIEIEKPIEKIVEKKVYVQVEVPVEAKKEVSDIQFFIGSRVARDIFMKDKIAPYFSYGLLAGIQIHPYDNFKYELGLNANQMVNDDVYSINTGYALAGAYLTTGKHQGFFIGVRGLSGIVTNQKQQADFDGGGEGRFGYENSHFSIGFGAGRTRYATRVGLELSMKL
ncbi:hypothetical protein GCL60_02745 [Silvanigrella paludirubra]|uniref:Outer membrane beta-barrel protein n=1 Tax=Silvanigrella paludirubra TaxID=2499159 RepID=A0A6N6VXM2_9BACT|nr:hypothetical protein [Silvanigrella paludirubra]KAB8040864.1 hypothetical protein GCL60_02745 [Silvanigrella paludirubra]